MTPMFDPLQNSGISLLILLLVRANTAPPPILSKSSQECVRNADFVDFTKDHEFLFKGFA